MSPQLPDCDRYISGPWFWDSEIRGVVMWGAEAHRRPSGRHIQHIGNSITLQDTFIGIMGMLWYSS